MSRPDIPEGFEAPPPMTDDERDEIGTLREKYEASRLRRMEDTGHPLRKSANPGRPR